MRKIELTVYSYEELSNKSKEIALSNMREVTDTEWAYYDWKNRNTEALNSLGFRNISLMGSFNNCQGDGASFTANIDYEDMRRVLPALPEIKEQEEIRIVRSPSRYYHENTCHWDIGAIAELLVANTEENSSLVFAKVFSELEAWRKSYCKNLERQGYLYMDEVLSLESMLHQGYEFYEDGSIFGGVDSDG